MKKLLILVLLTLSALSFSVTKTPATKLNTDNMGGMGWMVTPEMMDQIHKNGNKLTPEMMDKLYKNKGAMCSTMQDKMNSPETATKLNTDNMGGMGWMVTPEMMDQIHKNGNELTPEMMDKLHKNKGMMCSPTQK